ncbi:hypothetical protein [Archangium lansingense]|uniref:Uncharacterized protein n=1 Tax=Archangium lansingense TaxID=2995310 RepID=A0ABT4A235_9BACT|nr:hypothetical protein [Archangium lansinium]MCY1075704.1 hypothetical protein [Archangium lansinium]
MYADDSAAGASATTGSPCCSETSLPPQPAKKHTAAKTTNTRPMVTSVCDPISLMRHEVVARAEQELLVEQELLKKHPELVAALGTLSADEAKALDAAGAAVEQLGPHERQLVQKALSNQRNTVAEQESKLQDLRDHHKRLAETWLAWESEEALPRRESPPAVDDVEERLRASLATGGVSLSTAYPWSRWPALLLDEPLQPHGPLHPAAFVEVLRELVRERKYQVILSTRDKALAEGMRRKMVAAGIDCVTCRYGGLGPAGVLYNAV